MNVLVVAPHPDDETLGCGATIHNLAGRGHKITVITVTKGDTSPEAEKEHLAALEILGVDTHLWFPYPSPNLEGHLPMHGLVGVLAPYLDVDRIYFPYAHDLHQEHQYVHRAVLIGARPPNRATLYAYETLSSTDYAPVTFTPNYWQPVNMEDGAAKIDAFSCYTRQHHPQNGLRTGSVLACHMVWRGAQIREPYAEAFQLIRGVGRR